MLLINAGTAKNFRYAVSVPVLRALLPGLGNGAGEFGKMFRSPPYLVALFLPGMPNKSIKWKVEKMLVPREYVDYVKKHGIFEGFTTGEPGYIELWTLEDLEKSNKEIQVLDLAPGYLAFAGNGGGEVLAFDSDGAVFMLPSIGMELQYAKKIAESFNELVPRFEQ